MSESEHAEVDQPIVELAEPLVAVRLSMDLTLLRDGLTDEPLSVGELEESLRGRGVALLLMLLALPFCILPIPGLSTPFGVIVFLIGLRLMLGQKPWLPIFARNLKFPPDRLRKLLTAAIRFTRNVEKLAKPRMGFLQTWPGMANLIGFGIATAGLLLLLPLPIPFSNTLPAFAVVLLSAGMVERDGLFVLLGHILAFAAWAYVVAIGIFGKAGVSKLWEMISG